MKNKGLVILGVVAVAGGLAYLLTRKPSGSSLSIQLYDEDGNPVGVNGIGDAFSAGVVEGRSYTVRLTVTNQSTKLNQPTPATLKVQCVVHITGITADVVGESRNVAFTAGQTQSFDWGFTVPMGSGGMPMIVNGAVYSGDSAMTQLAYGPAQTFTIQSEIIVYKASLIINPQ